MGNQTSVNKSQIQKSIHPKLGSIIVYSKNGTKIIQKIYSIKTLEELNQFQKNTAEFSSKNSQFLFLPSQQLVEKVGLCGYQASLKIQYPYFAHSLQNQIVNRKLIKAQFKQSELWYLLITICNAGIIFQKRNQKMGDVRIQNFMMNFEGIVRFYCKYSAPGENDNIMKTFQNKQATFLSPEELIEVKQRNPNPKHLNPTKSDIFSAGIVLLQVGILRKGQELYDYTKLEINKPKLNQFLQQFKSKYPILLGFIVQKMLEQDPNQRPFFSQVAALLQPYPQIYQLQSFTPDINASYKNLIKLHQQNPASNSKSFQKLLLVLGMERPFESIGFTESIYQPMPAQSKIFQQIIQNQPLRQKIQKIESKLYSNEGFTVGIEKEIEIRNRNTQINTKIPKINFTYHRNN